MRPARKPMLCSRKTMRLTGIVNELHDFPVPASVLHATRHALTHHEASCSRYARSLPGEARGRRLRTQREEVWPQYLCTAGSSSRGLEDRARRPQVPVRPKCRQIQSTEGATPPPRSLTSRQCPLHSDQVLLAAQAASWRTADTVGTFRACAPGRPRAGRALWTSRGSPSSAAR